MPPPSWMGSLPATAPAMARIPCSFLSRPAAAPLRSTTCSRLAPNSSQRFAVAAGSSENTVALSIAPCFRRTHLPSFRSIAGMISMRLSGRGCGPGFGTFRRWLPGDEVGEQLQPRRLAFLRVKLHGEYIVARRGAGEPHAVDALRGHKPTRGRIWIIAVHEIKAAALRDAVPQGM